ncbi:MAG: hypothetical protein IME93_00110 [Proteobacteria bacterium]|nr:hypothetical protein [Pseudomonadota bacterium]
MHKAVFISLVLVLFSLNVHAGGNPGKSAMDCVRASTDGEELTFKNRCGKRIFVVWCGNLKYSKKRCGDGPKNSYYTKSANIDAYGKNSTLIKGRYQYAACVGRIGFGTKGIKASANNNGSFRCERTGSYR